MKGAFSLVAAFTVAGALTVSAFPRGAGDIVSATRAFSLDGRWYSVGKPSDGDSVLREKLKDMGIDVSKIPSGIISPSGFFIEALSDISSKRTAGTVSVPSCLREEHVMQLTSENGSIDISFGKISASRDQAKKGLVALGWKLSGTINSGNPVSFATIRNERENSIVLLEEKEGSYLSIRQLEK